MGSSKSQLTMIVAVALPFPPPQHSPMFGHLASSQTVCKPSPRRSFLMPLYDFPVGIGCFRNDGSRGLAGQLCIRRASRPAIDSLLCVAQRHTVFQRLARGEIGQCEAIV